MNKPKNYEKELKAIMDALADSAIEATDQEVLEDVRQQGWEPKILANEVRKNLLDAVKNYQKRNLLEAKKKYEISVADLKKGEHNLPPTAEGRLRLLKSIFAAKPYMSNLLTAQHRDFKTLSDADVESLLKQLQKLGALADIKGED